jgi:hypothetical protein
MIVWLADVVAQNEDSGATSSGGRRLDLHVINEIGFDAQILGATRGKHCMQRPVWMADGSTVIEVTASDGDIFRLGRVDTSVEVACRHTIDSQIRDMNLLDAACKKH